jgi:PadR family transcriptional regulator, regulatory protein PadR
MEPSILYLLMEKSHHGYELMTALPQLGFLNGPADPGAIYRTLRHLEEAGLVTSTWDTASAGAAKRLYTITQSGQVHLKLWTESLRQRWRALDAFIKRLDQTLDNN